jgi:hypothetical protein
MKPRVQNKEAKRTSILVFMSNDIKDNHCHYMMVFGNGWDPLTKSVRSSKNHVSHLAVNKPIHIIPPLLYLVSESLSAEVSA